MQRHELNILDELITYTEIHKDGGLTFEEREVVQIVHTWKAEGVSVRQVCPHCLSVAPYGDGRYDWVMHHMHSALHRAVWGLKRKLRMT